MSVASESAVVVLHECGSDFPRSCCRHDLSFYDQCNTPIDRA